MVVRALIFLYSVLQILMVDRLVDLYDKVALLQTNVPDFVKQYDVTVNGVSQPTAALSADAL